MLFLVLRQETVLVFLISIACFLKMSAKIIIKMQQYLLELQQQKISSIIFETVWRIVDALISCNKCGWLMVVIIFVIRPVSCCG